MSKQTTSPRELALRQRRCRTGTPRSVSRSFAQRVACARSPAAHAVLHDLHRTCIHEYAHFLVAQRFGICAWISIWRNPGGGEVERFYVGRTSFGTKIPKCGRPLIGLAGNIAELLVENRELDPDLAFEVLGWGDLSATDAELAGDFTIADVNKCISLLRRLWTALEAAASYDFETICSCELVPSGLLE